MNMKSPLLKYKRLVVLFNIENNEASEMGHINSPSCLFTFKISQHRQDVEYYPLWKMFTE
jgi:hypothetical protein